MEVKKKKCVLIGCNNTAVGICNNCGIPVCEKHSRKTGQFYICTNCYEYLKKLTRGFNRDERRLLKILILCGFLLSLPMVTKACITADWKFTLNIESLKINQENLEILCNEKNCYVTEDFIAIRSSYDERVAIIIGKTSSILGFKGITFRLPYILKEGVPEVSEINPYDYDWQSLVKTDLNFLRELEIIEISSEDIEKISSLATNGKNIFFCNSSWQALEANCVCEENERVCVKCGAPIFNIKIPESLLNREKVPAKNQLSNYFLLIPFTMFFVIVVVIKKLNLVHQIFKLSSACS